MNKIKEKNITNLEKKSEKPKEDKPERICRSCGKTFSPPANDYLGLYHDGFCKILCRTIYYTIPLRFLKIRTDKQSLLESSIDKSLFITGKAGTGKSVFMANLAVKRMTTKQGNIEWISYPAFIMKLQGAFQKDRESPFDIAENIARHYGYLFIDDLGAEKLTDYVRQITYFIINEREQRVLPTVITSNFTLQEIAEQIDVRISSRIAGMCEVLKFTGVDQRIKRQT